MNQPCQCGQKHRADHTDNVEFITLFASTRGVVRVVNSDSSDNTGESSMKTMT